MRTPTSTPARGVYVAPWVGPNDEVILIAISQTHRLVGEPLVIPKGTDHVAASDEMWRRLDEYDATRLKIVV